MSGPLVVTAGTFALDTIETPSGSAVDVGGGSAPWSAVAARLFCRAEAIGVVGVDFPPGVLDALRAAGIGLTHVERRTGPTFRWRVRYGEDGDRETLDTNRSTAESGAPLGLVLSDPVDGLFVGSMDPSSQRAVLDAARRPTVVALDTMAHWVRERPRDVLASLARVDVLLLTADELDALAGGGGGPHALRALGPSWVIVKAGAAGAVAHGPGVGWRVGPAPTPRVVDPTGAGDAFAGALTASLATAGDLGSASMREALRVASAAGSLAVASFSWHALLSADRAALVALAAEVAVTPT